MEVFNSNGKEKKSCVLSDVFREVEQKRLNLFLAPSQFAEITFHFIEQIRK